MLSALSQENTLMDHEGEDSSSDNELETTSAEEEVSMTKPSLSVLPEDRVLGPTASPVTVVVQKSDSSSVSSNDIVSKRESIRARLREREKRLTDLVRSSSSDTADSFLGQMRSNKDKLDQIEAEKSELEKELQRLKTATDDDEFLKEKMQGIQEGFEKQVALIQKLEDENVMKKNEIQHLRSELVAKLRRIVELEFDLQTHEVHYTEYADQQIQLGEGALQELKRIEEGTGQDAPITDSSESTVGSGNRQPLTARKAHKLISKLLFDLDNLERRYKENKLECEEQLHTIRLENEELKTQIKLLENRVREVGDGTQSSEDKSVDPAQKAQVDYLRKQVETLHAKGQLHREEIITLQSELHDMKSHYESKERRAKVDLERLMLDNTALNTRVQQLEVHDPDGASSFALIQESIHGAFGHISKIESALAIKDRQIATLKKDLTKLRMKQAANGESKGFTAGDRDILQLANESSHSAIAELGETGSTYVKELQRQLHAAQQLLVKKDQELVIERAKAASTAAGLIARITELSRTCEKQTPQESGSQRNFFNKQKSSRKDLADQSNKHDTPTSEENQRRRKSFLGRQRSSRRDTLQS